MNHLERAQIKETLSLDDATIFHGHKGPFLVIGYRAGIYALEILKPEKKFDLEVEAFLPYKKPYSCILDGLQCSTGCTLGKGNMKYYDDSDRFAIVIRDRKRNKAVIFTLKNAYRDIFVGEPSDVATKKAEETPLDEIFEIAFE